MVSPGDKIGNNERMVLRGLSVTVIAIQRTKMPIMRPTRRYINIALNSVTNANVTTGNNISRFYDGAQVFLTGGTGLLGKVVLEKLLRSCVGIENIYVLIRPKRGVGIHERLNDVLGSTAFDKIRECAPRYLDKIKPVAGNICQTNLGLSELDRRLLADKVDIVFHSAATVKFNEPLKTSITVNTQGTKYITELCKEMTHLKSFVHVSTIFSDPDRPELDEQVYESAYDPRPVINLVETLPPETLSLITPHIRGEHPNTYTISKKLAERLVLEFSENAPTAIVRPSIIIVLTCANKFLIYFCLRIYSIGCLEGTITRMGGQLHFSNENVYGVLPRIPQKYHLQSTKNHRLIPVDIVANTVIAAAWHTTAHRSNTMRVYNCTSGQINGIIWKDVRDLVQKYAVEYPSKHVIDYPGFTFTTNKTTHLLHQFAFQYIPACISDLLLFITGHEHTNVKTYNITSKAARMHEYFQLRDWKFNVSTFRGLVEAVSKAEDGKDFSIDMSQGSGFEWDSYIKNYLLGVRLHMLKDDLSSLEQAKAKLNRLYWSKKAIKILTVGIFVGALLL